MVFEVLENLEAQTIAIEANQGVKVICRARHAQDRGTAHKLQAKRGQPVRSRPLWEPLRAPRRKPPRAQAVAAPSISDQPEWRRVGSELALSDLPASGCRLVHGRVHVLEERQPLLTARLGSTLTTLLHASATFRGLVAAGGVASRRRRAWVSATFFVLYSRHGTRGAFSVPSPRSTPRTFGRYASSSKRTGASAISHFSIALRRQA